MYYGKRWQTIQELDDAIAAYIEFYNNHRIKVSLNGMSIARYRMAAVA
ncbi:IS3 family transposase [Corynebacterium diphtheriae]|nr:IS3 family transposase [Corynebacterium diphtheriae]OWN67912.1 transposase [Corynebacterium diphtheriae bv. gravis]CAB0880695.1 transposase [Corynebacterium diphtheriae]